MRKYEIPAANTGGVSQISLVHASTEKQNAPIDRSELTIKPAQRLYSETMAKPFVKKKII